MKALLVGIYLIAATLLSGQAYASDLEKLYPQQLKEAKNLYQLAYRYFRGPGSLPEGETLTPEMVKNPLRQAMFYKLWDLVGLAVDADYDLSSLEEFGLLKEHSGYSIDYKKHPQWADIDSLFLTLKNPEDLYAHARELRQKGFSQFDMDILDNYLKANNPEKQLLLAERNLVEPYSLKHDVKQLSPEQMLLFHESIQKLRANILNNWGNELLEKLSLQKQRILISHLQQYLGSVSLGKLPISIESLQVYANELVSGRQLAAINDLITRETNKRK